MHGGSRAKRTWPIALAIGAWLLVVCGSFVALWKYKSTPGPRADRIDWPVASHISRATDRDTLVMFAHPYCPCTRASMNQLSEIMAHAGDKTRAFVLFAPVDDEDVRESDLWSKAAAIHGVTPLVDEGGTERARFHAETSGHVVVFDRSGHAIFSGGITGARGHEGENPGSQRVLALLTTGTAERAESPIFGCSLKD